MERLDSQISELQAPQGARAAGKKTAQAPAKKAAPKKVPAKKTTAKKTSAKKAIITCALTGVLTDPERHRF